MILKTINCQNGSAKLSKFSRFQMAKRTALLNFHLAKSSDPEKFRRIMRQSEFFYEFLGDKSPVTLWKKFSRQSWKSLNGLS